MVMPSGDDGPEQVQVPQPQIQRPTDMNELVHQRPHREWSDPAGGDWGVAGIAVVAHYAKLQRVVAPRVAPRTACAALFDAVVPQAADLDAHTGPGIPLAAGGAGAGSGACHQAHAPSKKQSMQLGSWAPTQMERRVANGADQDPRV